MPHTPGYMEWRGTIAHVSEFLHFVIPRTPTSTLLTAYDGALVGVARERLDPERSAAEFHRAAGMILGELSKRGIKP